MLPATELVSLITLILMLFWLRSATLWVSWVFSVAPLKMLWCSNLILGSYQDVNYTIILMSCIYNSPKHFALKTTTHSHHIRHWRWWSTRVATDALGQTESSVAANLPPTIHWHLYDSSCRRTWRQRPGLFSYWTTCSSSWAPVAPFTFNFQRYLACSL